jgi:hypothetical protein
MHSRFLNRLE